MERIEMSADSFDRLKRLGSGSTGLEDVVLGFDGWASTAVCSLIRHFGVPAPTKLDKFVGMQVEV